ncbi:MAG: hypothetical protein Q7S32_04045 [bacterium]|nr:hypothetical protein [bacterium]
MAKPRRKRKGILEELDQYDYVDDEYIGEASPDYIEAIGLYVLQFSALEHSINLQIADRISYEVILLDIKLLNYSR